MIYSLLIYVGCVWTFRIIILFFPFFVNHMNFTENGIVFCVFHAKQAVPGIFRNAAPPDFLRNPAVIFLKELPEAYHLPNGTCRLRD